MAHGISAAVGKLGALSADIIMGVVSPPAFLRHLRTCHLSTHELALRAPFPHLSSRLVTSKSSATGGMLHRLTW